MNIKNSIKTIFVLVIAAIAFFGVSVAKASAGTAVFNTDPRDLITTSVSNATLQPNCINCWTPSVEMQPGQIVSVRVYYHNTGTDVARDTRIRISPEFEPAVNTKLMTGGVWASNASLVRAYATVRIPGTPQTITYIPGTAAWFPDQIETNPRYLNAAQQAALFSTAGFSIGDIAPDSTCQVTFCHQGSVVARFRIGNAVTPPTVYVCSDSRDNDGDGLTDFPSDPGCSSPTDNDEYNQIIPPVVYICSDARDNDGDGLTDFPSDPGCSSPTDNDEYNQIIPPQAFVTATTQPATNITETNATINGSFATNQSQAATWFEWGTSQSLGNTTAQQIMSGSSGSMSAPLYGLSPNVRYFFRACADTSVTAPSCGGVLQFMTSIQVINAPTVITNSGNCSATQNSFSMSGSFNSNGQSAVTTWFQYGIAPSLNMQGGNQNQSSQSGTMNFTVYGLQANTTYTFQAVAQNQGGTSYGTVLTCTTNGVVIPPPPVVTQPVVTTVGASNVSQTSARLNGFLNTAGGSSCTSALCFPVVAQADVWFDWGTNPSLGYTTQRQTVSGGMTFSNFLPNLQPNTTYFFRAMAQNNYGIATGQTLSFTTAPAGQGPQVIYVNTNTGGSGPVVMLKLESNFSSVCVGDTVYYTATYENLTRKSLKDVVVQVILPQEETFLRASRGSYADGPNTITVLVGDLAGREKGTFQIESTVNSRGKADDTLVATGTVVYTIASSHIQGDAIAYSLINVDCGGNSLAGLALFGSGSCIFWIIVLLIILIAVLLTRRSYRY
ncbi:MAG: hypothetical protein KBB70_00080 [Candidatus Pacebacteria bacterium]|jgi:hypothetical protein|nr:hypothetical protein [Candidatus Paceibacterota bacterium]